MLGAMRVSRRQKLLAYNVDHDLAFKGVALFLRAVVTLLFFLGRSILGRSIGVSVASTNTTVHGVSLPHGVWVS